MQQLSLESMMRIVRRFWKWLVLCGAVGGLLMALVTHFLIPEKYVSQATLHIQNGVLSEESTQVSSSNLAAAKTLVDSTAIIFSSDYALEPAIEVLDDEDATISKLRASLSFSATTNSEAVIIRATSTDPAEAYAYCSAMVEVAPEVMQGLYTVARVNTLEKPKTPTAPSSPNLVRNTLLGVIVGVLLMLIAAVIHYMTDMRVGSEEDVKQRMDDLMVLGEIPTFSELKKEVRNG